MDEQVNIELRRDRARELTAELEDCSLGRSRRYRNMEVGRKIPYVECQWTVLVFVVM
jgi:hypothetical protein